MQKSVCLVGENERILGGENQHVVCDKYDM